MTQMPPPARDGAEAVPIERSASGAAAAFDGNYTNAPESWLFSNARWRDDAFPELLEQLTFYMVEVDHLAWVVFPPPGFRI